MTALNKELEQRQSAFEKVRQQFEERQKQRSIWQKEWEMLKDTDARILELEQQKKNWRNEKNAETTGSGDRQTQNARGRAEIVTGRISCSCKRKRAGILSLSAVGAVVS